MFLSERQWVCERDSESIEAGKFVLACLQGPTQLFLLPNLLPDYL